jgi:hypothetical protein
MDDDTPLQLFSIPIKQQAWYLQIKEKIVQSKRPLDRMSIAEISQIYRERRFLCDKCGKELQNPNNIPLEEHVIHLINPLTEWACEDCFQSDLRNGRIIAMSEQKPEGWQEESR